ncbi:MAG: trans-aconitate 2-methyltransferase [Aestuariivirga sp.]|nr:trans-aconitate 2-methyltransferase [Aestuariivirga sp.]
MEDWRPEDYLRFSDERSRPARDLLARIPLKAPELVYDLGCGPGNSTALLREAYPRAKLVGLDNSPTMLARARKDLPQVKFREADIATWPGDPNADLLYANASFQWVPDHVSVLLRLLRGLKAGGVLALQMPDNLAEPSHRLMRETAKSGPFAKALRHAAGSREVIRTPNEYYTLLKPHCRSLDIWHTAYYHILDGVQGIVDFVSTTGLRPFLDPLDDTTRGQFVDAYRANLAKAYPAVPDGKVILRFPRLFLVAQV